MTPVRTLIQEWLREHRYDVLTLCLAWGAVVIVGASAGAVLAVWGYRRRRAQENSHLEQWAAVARSLNSFGGAR